jgi:putative transposase
MTPDEAARRRREGEVPAEPKTALDAATSQSDFPVRKHPAHGVHLKNGQPTIVFLTVSTQARKPWLPFPEIHEQLRQVWTAATAWLVGRYIIMPDHIHLFAALSANLEIPFDNWVRYWKSQFGKLHRRKEHDWQTDHWDTRMRNQEQYVEKLDYAINNPVRGGLVTRPEDWPYQGEIYELAW